MKKIYIIISALLLSMATFAQVDTEFWFAVPDITNGDYGADNSIFLTVVSFDKETTVNISQPAEVDGFPGIDTTFTIPANSVRTLDFSKYKSQLEVWADRSFPFGVPHGLHITADNKISAYYANKSNDSEIYTMKGKNALGTDFLVPMQYEYNCGAYGAAFNSIEILATEDSTEITIALQALTTSELQTTAKQTITIKLNRGWCYSFAAKGKTGSEHLYNTRIKSNKPIAVNSTDDSVTPGDLVGDQLTPVNLAGKNYIAVKNYGNIEKVYIFPTEKNTNIWIDEIAQPQLVTLEDKMMINLNDANRSVATFIRSDKPIVVFQLTSKKNASELGGAIIPKIDCTGSLETVYRSGFGDITLDVITKTAYTNSFTMNGQTGVIKPSDFAVVTANPEWSYARIPLLASDPLVAGNGGVIKVKNSLGYFHVGALDYPTDANSCSYGYFSDFQTIKLDAVAGSNAYVSGETLKLELLNIDALTNIEWTKPDGTKVGGNPLLIPNAGVSDAGMYEVNAESKDGCSTPPTSYVVVNVFKPEKINYKICSGDSQLLSSSGIAPYTWSPVSGLANTQTITVSPLQTTVYKVKNHKPGQNILVNTDFKKGNIEFTSDYVYAGTNVASVPAASGKYSVIYSARAFSSEFNNVFDHDLNTNKGVHLIAKCTAVPGKKIWSKTVEVSPNTQYQLSAWFVGVQRNGSVAKLRYSINDIVQGVKILPSNPEIVSKKESWRQYSTLWNSGNRTTVTLSIVTDDGITEGAGVCIDNITFSPYVAVTDTMSVAVVATPKPKITGDTIICQGAAVLDAGAFTNGDAYTTYNWKKSGSTTTLSSSKVFSATESGKYLLEVTNDICIGTDSFYIAPSDELQMTVESTKEICPDESVLSFTYVVQKGEFISYNVLFDDKAKSAGFENKIQQSASNDELVVAIPANVLSDTYNAEFKMISGSVCQDTVTVPVQIKIKINPKTLIAQKWNDVLALYNKDYNGGYSYSSYQWYKNGEILVGETKSYLYLGNGTLNPADTYTVELTKTDGEKITTCAFTPEARAAGIPSVVSPLQKIKLPDINTNGSAVFCDLSGLIYSRILIDKDNNEIKVPARKGLYILEIVTNETRLQYKMIVR